jgi:hypothetical protein
MFSSRIPTWFRKLPLIVSSTGAAVGVIVGKELGVGMRVGAVWGIQATRDNRRVTDKIVNMQEAHIFASL